MVGFIAIERRRIADLLLSVQQCWSDVQYLEHIRDLQMPRLQEWREEVETTEYLPVNRVRCKFYGSCVLSKEQLLFPFRHVGAFHSISFHFISIELGVDTHDT